MNVNYHSEERLSTVSSIFQAALHYAEQGFSVIPIEPRGKKPLIAWEQFQKVPADSAQIEQWGKEFPSANIGVVTGSISGLVVIDVDSESAKEKLKQAASDYELDTVPRTRTGRGWQLFFKHPGTTVPNAVAILPGLDVRGDGGYVVAPPSLHPNGRIYRWEVALGDELPKLPQQLFTLITRNGREQSYRQRFDTARALAGVPEGERDTVLFKLACKLRSADVPQEMAETLVLEAANNCKPRFPEKTALEKVAWVYAKYQARDNRAKEPEFWPEFLTAKDILQAPKDPTRWILEGCLPVGGCSVLAAKPKVGKTHLAADLSICVARGEPFLARATQKSPVAYLFLDGTLPEIADVFVRLGLKESDPVFLHAGSAPADALAWIMHTVEEKSVRLIIVDTMQKLLHIKDLNDYAEVTNKMEPVLKAARDGTVHVMFLHHAGKESRDDLDAAIGSTAIRGQCYTYLFEKRLPNSQRRILLSDQRGGTNFPETAIGFNRLTRRLEIQCSMEEAEIEEAIPKIVEAMEAKGAELTEKEIRRLVPIRDIVVSKALKQMFKANKVERAGQGKKGNPFRYSLSRSLTRSLMADSSNSCPGERVLGGGGAGHESEKSGKGHADATEIRVPKVRDMNGTRGTRTDTNPKRGVSGHESEERPTQEALDRLRDDLQEEPDIDVFDLALDLEELEILQTKSQEELRATAMVKNEFSRGARVVK